jgi:hypothetical protein
MANVIIASGNIVDQGTLSGGVAFETMPLNNLKKPQLGKKWRAASLDPAATQFLWSIGSGKPINVVILANHNLGVDAQYRLRCNSDPAFPGPSPSGFAGTPWGGLLLSITYGASIDPVPPSDYYDSGWKNVWPAVYNTSDLEWEQDNFWSGTYEQSDIEGYVRTLIVILPETIRPRYVKLELLDPNNPDGYVEAGRFFLAPSWQPERNASYGAQIGWNSNTEVQVALSEEEYFNEKKAYRVAKVEFKWMTEDEALFGPFEITRRAGISGEVAFIYDPADTVHAIRRQFLGRFVDLNPLEFPEYFIKGQQRATLPMVIKERVG